MLLLKQCTSSHNTFSIGIISIFLPTILSSVEPNAFSSQPDGIKFKTNPMPFQQVIPSQNTSYTSSLTNHSLELTHEIFKPKTYLTYLPSTIKHNVQGLVSDSASLHDALRKESISLEFNINFVTTSKIYKCYLK